jgi:hypothetical protein
MLQIEWTRQTLFAAVCELRRVIDVRTMSLQERSRPTVFVEFEMTLPKHDPKLVQ